MARFREVLKNKNFFFLWLGQVISNFGDRLTQMALVALVYQRNPGSAMALAKLISFTIIPVFIIGPIAGVWIDRLNKRNVMIISDILRGVFIFTIPLFIMANQILLIYTIVFLTFSISRFFIPSKMAMIPELVPRDKLLIANTLSDTTHMIGNVAGLVVAGFIVNIRYVGAIGGFYIDSATFFVSAALLAFIVNSGLARKVKDDLLQTKKAFGQSLRRSVIGDLKETFSYITARNDMRFIVFVFFLLMAGLGAISCVIIVFIQEAFGSVTRDLGFLGMCLVAGLFLGTMAYGRFGQKMEKKRVVFLSFIAAGISIVLFTLLLKQTSNLLVAWTAAAFVGLCVSPIMVSTNTLTHEVIAEEIRGRIFSSLEVVIHLAFLVFMFFAAYLAKYVDRFWILIAVGALFAACGLIGVAGEYRKKPI